MSPIIPKQTIAAGAVPLCAEVVLQVELVDGDVVVVHKVEIGKAVSVVVEKGASDGVAGVVESVVGSLFGEFSVAEIDEKFVSAVVHVSSTGNV